MWSPDFQAIPPRRGAEVGGKPLRIPVPTQLGIENLVALARTREQPPSRPPSGRRRVAQAHEVLRYLSKAPAAPLLAEGSAALAVSEERYLHLPLGRLLPGERLPDGIQDPYPTRQLPVATAASKIAPTIGPCTPNSATTKISTPKA